MLHFLTNKPQIFQDFNISFPRLSKEIFSFPHYLVTYSLCTMVLTYIQYTSSLPTLTYDNSLTFVLCIFVVSSNHTDPLAMLQTLSSSQQQQQSQFPNKLPHWFSPNILKYYVLVHDVVEAEASK